MSKGITYYPCVCGGEVQEEWDSESSNIQCDNCDNPEPLKLIDLLTTEHINQLMDETCFDKEKLNVKYNENDLKVFESSYELLNWLNEGESTWEDYLNQELDFLLDRLNEYKGLNMSAFEALVEDRFLTNGKIFTIGNKEKYVFIY